MDCFQLRKWSPFRNLNDIKKHTNLTNFIKWSKVVAFLWQIGKPKKYFAQNLLGYFLCVDGGRMRDDVAGGPVARAALSVGAVTDRCMYNGTITP